MYIFLVSLLFVVPSMIADQDDYNKKEQVFKNLPDDFKCTICVAEKNKFFDYPFNFPFEFFDQIDPNSNVYNPQDKAKATTVRVRHDKDSGIVTLTVIEKTGFAGDLLGGGKPLSKKTTRYLIPFEIFAEWCKEHQKAQQEKLKTTQQGDN